MIKFRAYIDGKFYYFDLIKLIDIACRSADDICYREADIKVVDWLESGNQPDRWIGRFDSNNDEIYENDIVELFTSKLHGLAIWNPIRLNFKLNFESIQNKTMEYAYHHEEDLIYHSSNLSIIGNAHENPELLG